MEDIYIHKKDQINPLSIKISRPEMKNTLDRIKGKLDIAKEKVCKFDNVIVETIQNETQGAKR